MENLAIQTLEHIPYGIVIVSESMKVILHNGSAANLISVADGISLTHGHLALNQSGMENIAERINESLNRAGKDELPRTVVLRVERPSGRTAYQLIARPLCQQSDDDPPRHHGVWILSIYDPEQNAELPHSLLRDYFHMTEAEINICRQLFICGGTDNVANALGISPDTVKTHLQRIYSKCGVRSQSMLIMRLTLSLMN